MPTIVFDNNQQDVDVDDFPANTDRGTNTGPVLVRAGQSYQVTHAEAQHLAQRGVNFRVQDPAHGSTVDAEGHPREVRGSKEEVGVTEAGGISVANARLPGEHAGDKTVDNSTLQHNPDVKPDQADAEQHQRQPRQGAAQADADTESEAHGKKRSTKV